MILSVASLSDHSSLITTAMITGNKAEATLPTSLTSEERETRRRTKCVPRLRKHEIFSLSSLFYSFYLNYLHLFNAQRALGRSDGRVGYLPFFVLFSSLQLFHEILDHLVTFTNSSSLTTFLLSIMFYLPIIFFRVLYTKQVIFKWVVD